MTTWRWKSSKATDRKRREEGCAWWHLVRVELGGTRSAAAPWIPRSTSRKDAEASHFSSWESFFSRWMAGWDLSEVKGRGGATGLLDVGVF
jgi:hypothetical protein